MKPGDEFEADDVRSPLVTKKPAKHHHHHHHHAKQKKKKAKTTEHGRQRSHSHSASTLPRPHTKKGIDAEHGDGGDVVAETVKGSLFRRVWEEMKAILWLAVPIMASFFLDNAMSTITLVFMGHMGARELAAGSLGLTLVNTTGMTVGNGLLLAQDTQAAHAWGLGKRKRLGVITQRAILVVFCYCAPISVLWLFADKILILLGQDPEISRMTRTFVIWMIPGLFPAMVYEAIRRHLQAMNIVMPITVIVMLSIPLETAFLFVCLQVFELGLPGCAIAVSLIYITQAIILIAYVLGARRTLGVSWPGFTRNAFSGWGRFLKLAVPSALMSCMEGWGFDIMSLFAGWIGTIPLAAHSALINTYYLGYMIPLGIGCASTTRIGTLLGERKPRRARLSYYLSLGLCVFFELLVALVLLSGRTVIAKIFCTDVNVVNMYVQIVPIACFVMLVDGGQISGSGALRGMGKQRFGMICNFIAFYVIGLPSGYLLTFTLKLGLVGIWLGIGACDAISAISFIVVLLCSNWRKAAVEIAAEAEAVKIAEKTKNIQGDDNNDDDSAAPTESTALTPDVAAVAQSAPVYGTYAVLDSDTEEQMAAAAAAAAAAPVVVVERTKEKDGMRRQSETTYSSSSTAPVPAPPQVVSDTDSDEDTVAARKHSGHFSESSNPEYV